METKRLGVRGATARLRYRPTFLVIGAQRSGTGTIYQTLVQHPAVLGAAVKEVHYFTKHYHEGADWYVAHFPLRARVATVRGLLGVRPAVGEATPLYLLHPRVPERVHAFDPRMKLIAIVRDPVERAYSHYRLQVQRRGETLSFEEALDREEAQFALEHERLRNDPAYDFPAGHRHTYVLRGLYAEQLERWLRFFPLEQLLVLTSEDAWSDPARTFREVCAFLGIPDRPLELRPRRGATYAPMRVETRERLAKTFEPHNRRLEELLGRPLPWIGTAREPRALTLDRGR